MPADIRLLGSTDNATIWAKEFMKVVYERWDGTTLPVNEALMEEWFGNLVVVARRRTHLDGRGGRPVTGQDADIVSDQAHSADLDECALSDNKHTLVGGQTLVNVHGQSQCHGRPCCIHNPSDHHMVTWPQNWRGDRRLMERVCPHGVGHPDPDDIHPGGVHGCDGCCSKS